MSSNQSPSRWEKGASRSLAATRIFDVRGVEFRESVQEQPGDIRRLEWQAYRTFAGSTHLISLILSTDSGEFAKHQDELYGILYSTKVTH